MLERRHTSGWQGGNRVSEKRIEFRRFHHVTMAVPDLDAAVADWTDRLGWAPSASSTKGSRFQLDDSYLELVAAGDESPGVTSVSVVVDDVDGAADRLRANGVSVTLSSEGHATVDPGAVNGVPLELRGDDVESGVAGQGSTDGGGAYRRLNHIVVAVSDA